MRAKVGGEGGALDGFGASADRAAVLKRNSERKQMIQKGKERKIYFAGRLPQFGYCEIRCSYCSSNMNVEVISCKNRVGEKVYLFYCTFCALCVNCQGKIGRFNRGERPYLCQACEMVWKADERVDS